MCCIQTKTWNLPSESFTSFAIVWQPRVTLCDFPRVKTTPLRWGCVTLGTSWPVFPDGYWVQTQEQEPEKSLLEPRVTLS